MEASVGCTIHSVDSKLCRSYLSFDRVTFPLIPGHETVGTVVALGPGVNRWKVGGEMTTK
jgi:D-arabinose 1-dehydrogenase-like Zn-dependent alcohol dehydrogenase